MPESKVKEMMAEARTHLAFMAAIYAHQVREGRFFLHEHPATATSWDEPCMTELAKMPSVDTIINHKCQCGLLLPDATGRPTPVKKLTKWMSNSNWMLKRLNKQCPGCSRHVQPINGRAAEAAKYPAECCNAAGGGVKALMFADAAARARP